MQLIAKKLPHLLQELPTCYARLLKKEGQILGIVMEDFTQGGRLRIEREWPPLEIEGAFIRGSTDSDSVDNMAIRVGGQRKLMDFYPIFEMGKREVNRRRLHQSQIEKDLDKYTIQINYAL